MICAKGEARPSGGRSDEFENVIRDLRACVLCRDAPRYGPPLPHNPRPVVQASPSARVCIISQAPGARVHVSGRPYTDPSGVRLRAWLGLNEEAFYNDRNIAIVPMGCCFPGNDEKGGDLPPRRECAETWHARILAQLPHVALVLLIGQYAQSWHLDRQFTKDGLTETVRQWRRIFERDGQPRMIPLPHPSWRNSGWLKRHAWFETELLPALRAEISRALPPDRPQISGSAARVPWSGQSNC
jgi:uracil-DNA glycosylase